MPTALQQAKPAGLRERKKLRTRQDLLRVAERLFSENEFADVTVEQIVELANVSQKTFFNYFQNKSQFLSEFIMDWLMTIGFWSFEESPVVDCRSAIVPTDASKTIEWIIGHRRIWKMAMQHTDFFDYIYKLDEGSDEFDPALHAAVRAHRQKRVALAQSQGLVRSDISAAEVCRLYDTLRIDSVRRWLYLSEESATPEKLHELFAVCVDALIKGIEKRD